MKEIDSRKDKVLVVLAIYTMGLLLGLFLYLLRILRWVKIKHWERFPKRQKRILVISNHTSLLEVVLIPVLFFRDYIFHPLNLSPWNTPDKSNYFDRRSWAWAKVRLIPIKRKNKRSAVAAINKIIRVLKFGGICVYFPEGGRTFKGKKFVESKKGKKLRCLKTGVASIILEADPLVVPVWIDNAENVLPNKPDKLYHCLPRFWKRVTVKIGKPIYIQGKSKKRIIQEITQILLELADEE